MFLKKSLFGQARRDEEEAGTRQIAEASILYSSSVHFQTLELCGTSLKEAAGTLTFRLGVQIFLRRNCHHWRPPLRRFLQAHLPL